MASTSSSSSNAGAQKRQLLPAEVKPSLYHVHLTPDLEAFTFTGTERVRIAVTSPVSSITLHAFSLKIDPASALLISDTHPQYEDNASTVSSSSSTIAITNITYDGRNTQQTATLQLASEVGPGEYALQLSFVGELNDQMVGFYRSKYTLNGETHYMATTQFEATDARRAFPCWDEPALKAQFEIVLTVPEKLVCLSNMPCVEQTKSEQQGLTTHRFARTPIMSTYLVAFLAGEMDHVEAATKDGVAVRVFTPVGKKDQGVFALDCGVKILEYYNEYYDIKYPLPKLDMVAIADFAAGAMENWGLVTYRETAVLIDTEKSGLSSKQRVAYVVGHELAHQWFGNLVTMEWWKELWLNEGFATFVGTQAVNHIQPDWDMWTAFGSDYFGRALSLDSLANSHAIEVEVYSSAQIVEIFDTISYCKGAAVIRMLSTFLGEVSFQKGLQIYLKRHQYQNAVTTDLWAAFSEASGKDVAGFMGKWTSDMGYPVLSVQRDGDRLQVAQRRFLISGGTTDPTTWQLQLNLRSDVDGAGEMRSVLMPGVSEQTVDLAALGCGSAGWLKLNADLTGFYRVHYSEAMAEALLSPVRSKALPPLDRLNVQADAFALAKAGISSTVTALRLASAYVDEDDFTVWSDLAAHLREVAQVWDTKEDAEAMCAFLRSVFSPVAARLGWDAKEGESDRTQLLRAVMVASAGLLGDQTVIAEAKTRFAKLIAGDASAVSVDLRFPVYRLVVEHGGVTEYEQVLNIFESSDMHEEKLRALRALGYTCDPELIQRTLDLGLDADKVRTQDVFYVYAGLGANPKSREATWKYVRENFATFQKRFSAGMALLPRIIASATQYFVTEEKAVEVEQFFAEHPVEEAARSIKQTLETIRIQHQWLERDSKAVSEFLAQ